MAVRQQQRRGTASQWTAANPILSAAEIGYETDTNKFKIGDGTNRWAALNYFVDLNTTIAGAPGLLNSLDEIAAAIGDDPAFFTTVSTNLSNHQADTTNIHGIANTALLVTQDDLSTALAGATVNQSALAGVGIDWNPTSEAFDIDSTIATRSYADTAEAEAISSAAADATTKATAAQAAAATDATTKADAAKAFATAADSTLRTAITTDIATAKSEAITAATDAVNAVIASAPAALNTLDELAAAIGYDENYASTITTALSAKAPLASPALTGNPTAPTQAVGNDSTRVATTEFVKAAIENISSLNLVLDGGGVE